MKGEMPARLTPVYTNEKSDREESGTSGDDDKKKDKEATQILLLRSLAHFALRRHQNCQPIERKDDESKPIPTCNYCTREPNKAARGKEYRHTHGQSQGETLTRVLTADEIDNAHLCTRVTGIHQQEQATIAAQSA